MLPIIFLSVLTVVVRRHHLTVGRPYYVTVEACNQVGLCRQVTSDGFRVDTSPPIAGDVFVGLGEHGEHSSFLGTS